MSLRNCSAVSNTPPSIIIFNHRFQTFPELFCCNHTANNVNAVKVDLEDDGRVIIYHTNQEIIDKTAEMIKNITREVEVGKVYEAKVVKIEDFGCFVEIWPGCEGLVHISQLDRERVNKTEDVVALGDEIIVKALGPDKKGRQNFSRKEALPKIEKKQKEG